MIIYVNANLIEAFKMPGSPDRTKLCILKVSPGYHLSCSQGALSHFGHQGVCFPLMRFISNILEVGLNE